MLYPTRQQRLSPSVARPPVPRLRATASSFEAKQPSTSDRRASISAKAWLSPAAPCFTPQPPECSGVGVRHEARPGKVFGQQMPLSRESRSAQESMRRASIESDPCGEAFEYVQAEILSDLAWALQTPEEFSVLRQEMTCRLQIIVDAGVTAQSEALWCQQARQVRTILFDRADHDPSLNGFADATAGLCHRGQRKLQKAQNKQ